MLCLLEAFSESYRLKHCSSGRVGSTPEHPEPAQPPILKEVRNPSRHQNEPDQGEPKACYGPLRNGLSKRAGDIDLDQTSSEPLYKIMQAREQRDGAGEEERRHHTMA